MNAYFQSLLLSDPKRTFGQKYGHKSQPWQEILYCTFTICQRPLSFNMVRTLSILNEEGRDDL